MKWCWYNQHHKEKKNTGKPCQRSLFFSFLFFSTGKPELAATTAAVTHDHIYNATVYSFTQVNGTWRVALVAARHGKAVGDRTPQYCRQTYTISTSSKGHKLRLSRLLLYIQMWAVLTSIVCSSDVTAESRVPPTWIFAITNW